MKKIIVSVAFKVLFISMLCYFVTNHIVCICVIHGDSMQPTFKDMQIVLENKMNKSYKTNDIVVIKKNDVKIIKRIIGVPNDRIIIKNQYIYVNDVVFDKNKITNAGNANVEIKLKSNEYFVLGDNRNNSIDSRFDEIGIINEKEIVGKIFN